MSECTAPDGKEASPIQVRRSAKLTSNHSYAMTVGTSGTEDSSVPIRDMSAEDDFNVPPTQRVLDPSTRLPVLPVSQPPPRSYGLYRQHYLPHYPPPYNCNAYYPAPNPSLYSDAHPPDSQIFSPFRQAMMSPQVASQALNRQLPAHMMPDKMQDSLCNLQPSEPNFVFGRMQPRFPQPYNALPGVVMRPPMYPPITAPAGRPEGINRISSISCNTVRSGLLEDFRTNRSRSWVLRDVWGHVVEFSRDSRGSRFVQQNIETATPEEMQQLYEEITDVPSNALLLIQDIFGNHVIQKLLEYGSQAQKNVLMATMQGCIFWLSLQNHGCRVIQKALEHLASEQQDVVIREITVGSHPLLCAMDLNGSYVIQKIIGCVPVERLDFIATFWDHVYELGTHPYGYRVLQKCLESLPEEHNRPLLEGVILDGIRLMQDRFGNYVIQYLIEHGQPQDRAILISKMQNHLTQLSQHQFASHVCEKALLSSDPETRYTLIDLLLKAESNASFVTSMMIHPYATLAVVEGQQKEELFNQVRSQLTEKSFAKKYSNQLSAIKKKMERYSMQ